MHFKFTHSMLIYKPNFNAFSYFLHNLSILSFNCKIRDAQCKLKLPFKMCSLFPFSSVQKLLCTWFDLLANVTETDVSNAEVFFLKIYKKKYILQNSFIPYIRIILVSSIFLPPKYLELSATVF